MRTQASPVLSLQRFANPQDACRPAEHPTSATALEDMQVTVGGSYSEQRKRQAPAWLPARRCCRNAGQEAIKSAWQRTWKVTMQKPQERPTGSREQFRSKGTVLGWANTGTQLHPHARIRSFFSTCVTLTTHVHQHRFQLKALCSPRDQFGSQTSFYRGDYLEGDMEGERG